MRYVALLRAINVGGRTVTMDRLRDVFSSLGFTDVQTVIASGNVLFSTRSSRAEALEARIERALQEALGFDVTTFLRQPEALAAVVAYDPMPHLAPPGDDPALSVLFVKEPPSAEGVRGLLSLRSDVDDFLVRGREVYWLRTTRRAGTLIAGPKLEKALRLPATARNITTVRKLALAR